MFSGKDITMHIDVLKIHNKWKNYSKFGDFNGVQFFILYIHQFLVLVIFEKFEKILF